MAGKEEVHLDSNTEGVNIVLKKPKCVLTDVFTSTIINRIECTGSGTMLICCLHRYAMFSSTSAAFGFEGIMALNLKEAISDSFAPIFPKVHSI